MSAKLILISRDLSQNARYIGRSFKSQTDAVLYTTKFGNVELSLSEYGLLSFLTVKSVYDVVPFRKLCRSLNEVDDDDDDDDDDDCDSITEVLQTRDDVLESSSTSLIAKSIISSLELELISFGIAVTGGAITA